MSFAAPAWLFGLLLVPVIWHLHRSGPILRTHPVESLDPWRGSRVDTGSSGARRRPDPAWVRRAAIAALLSLALAGPMLQRPAPRVTLWVDDSLSMQAAQSGGSRLKRGLAQVDAALQADGVVDLDVRTLSQPWRVLPRIDAGNLLSLGAGLASAEPELPDATHLDRSRSHWLLTDGADASVNAWLASAPVARVFQAGDSARNAAIAGVAVRPQPSDSATLALLVTVTNGGSTVESRRVDVATDMGPVESREVTIAPHATTALAFTTRAGAREVTARLSPSDSLPADDTVSVDTAALESVPVAVDDDCPASVSRAVSVHPALRMSSADVARLAIDCGTTTGEFATMPRLWLRDGPVAILDASLPSWSPLVRNAAPAMGGDAIRHTRGRIGPAGPGDTVLLESGGTPLAVLRRGPPRIVETAVDFGSPAATGDESVPLLLGALFDVALDQALLRRAALGGRGAAASSVVPLARLQARDVGGPAVRPHDTTLALPLLWIAIGLLAWDAVLLGRRLLRNRHRALRAGS